ncbi:Adenylate kinase isoenzyme 1-like [Scleropages formosus]|uniref:Adenylate kinase isoenzyme 1-like n=1 Tax=Scleropages formosus TaxID=113540 RepID=A0A0N8K313_SCLFO|nr:Adenylate kinase isoenzyme 1-like [Scleropages formosus]
MVGGPGSGKGLQCEKLEERYGYQSLSPGELLRRELQADSERGRFLQDVLERGEQMPADVTVELLSEAMATAPDPCRGFLIEGFPRSVRQADEFEAKVSARFAHLWGGGNIETNIQEALTFTRKDESLPPAP